MHYRKFGNTDFQVSVIGFGAWAIGGGAVVGNTAIGWGDADDEESRQALWSALDQGINFFDTADIYGLGHSEELIGDTIANEPGVIIATKVGNVARDEQFITDYSRSYIVNACEASLKRLRRSTIDYYQLHSARLSQLEQGECIEAMELLQQQGKIRYWGLSLNTFDTEPESRLMMDQTKGNGFQLVLNLINQLSLPVVKDAAAKGYGIIARMPLQFGLLTGKFDSHVEFAVNDHRQKRVTQEIIKAATSVLAPVWELCSKYNMSKMELALSYVISHPEVSVVIPGIRTREQVIANTSGLKMLSQEDVMMIENIGSKQMVGLMEMIKMQG